MSKTTDLCDENAFVRVLAPGLTSYGGQKAFSGRVATVKVKDDNVLATPPNCRLTLLAFKLSLGIRSAAEKRV